MPAQARVATFVERDLTFLRALAAGADAKEIAAEQGIPYNTVKTRLKQTYDRLGCRNAASAVAAAYEYGLIVPGSLQILAPPERNVVSHESGVYADLAERTGRHKPLPESPSRWGHPGERGLTDAQRAAVLERFPDSPGVGRDWTADDISDAMLDRITGSILGVTRRFGPPRT